MSADEDTELRDLVAQTLETNGVLGKIRVRIVLAMYCIQLMTFLFNAKKFIYTRETANFACEVK